MPDTQPPTDLGHFPVALIRRGRRLFRLVRRRDATGQVRSGWFFSSIGGSRPGRYDLPEPDGTCYFSDQEWGAWLEVFRGIRVVDRGDVDKRRLFTALRAGSGLRFGDLRSPKATAFGVSLDLSAGDVYSASQRWAAALRNAGLKGVVAHIRHDSSATARNVALFGKAGAVQRVTGWRTTSTELLDSPELVAALNRLGVAVLDRPYDVEISN